MGNNDNAQLPDSKKEIIFEKVKEEDAMSSESEESEDCVIAAERPAWDNKFQYIMAALGFAVGLGNIWRFPYLCHKNGGGAFLIPYFTMLILEGYPLYYLELAVGQRIRKGSIGVWTHINPKIAGIGFASMVVSILIGLYYNVILSWALFYLFNSFQSPLPWASCPDDNGTMIAECEIGGPTNYFWYRKTLDISSRIDNGGSFNWKIFGSLFGAWVLVFLGIMKGIKSSGKVMYFATAFPYIVLVAFFIRGMTLDGATEGVAYMFSPDLKRLLDPVVWREAATQIFFSLGLGYGAIIAYSSYNPMNNNCAKDAKFIATANSITSVFACITVFSVLGFRARLNVNQCHEHNRGLMSVNFPEYHGFENLTYDQLMDEMQVLNETYPQRFSTINETRICSMEHELKTIGQGTGLAFIAFADAILSFPLAPFWSFLFFSMLLCIGMSSEFGILQGFITTVLDSGFKVTKTKLTAVLCSGMFLVGVIFTLRSGSYLLDIFDAYSATLALVAIAFCETVAVSWLYGLDKFSNDIQDMVGERPGLYWRISWKYSCPIIMLVIFTASLVNMFLEVPTYKGWEPSLGQMVKQSYPAWVYLLIFILVSSSLICLPTLFFLYQFGYYKPEQFAGKSFVPSLSKSNPNSSGVTESAQPLTSPC